MNDGCFFGTWYNSNLRQTGKHNTFENFAVNYQEKLIFLISGTIVSHFQHRGAVTLNIISKCSWQMF